MARVSKNRKEAIKKIDQNKSYDLAEAANLVKETTTVKFDASVDLVIRLGVDPKNSNEMVRGTVSLPHGTGKDIKVLALCDPANEDEAKKAGADQAGLDEYVEKISKGWTDVDVIITTPQIMPKIAKLGKILGPRNLMPNPKSGTVTDDLAKTIKEVKAGKIDFKVDKYGIIHASIGKSSFTPEKIADNAKELLQTVSKLKPSSAKGIYFRSINMSSSMGLGIKVDTKVEEE